MSQDIDNLILAVSNALKSFAGGALPFENAKTEYQNLLEKYEKIKEKKKENENPGQIEGLCYFNNIENNALVTGIYSIDEKEAAPVVYYGDSDLNSKTAAVVFENRGDIKENIILRIPPDEEKNFLHNVYLYPLISRDLKKTVLASVSSSVFFSEDKFIFLGKMVKNTFSAATGETLPFRRDYFTAVSDEIETYLKSNIDETHSVRVTLFVFNMLERIFNHMGIDSLLEVSAEIQNYLKDIYKHNSKCITLSIRDYIVLEKINKSEGPKTAKDKSAEFTYKNISLPYHSLRIKIDDHGYIYSLWDTIMIFENYLSTGDIY